MNTDIKKDILTKNIFKLMIELSVPGILGMLIIGLFPLMDGIFAGRIIGQLAMTACGIAVPLTFINGGLSTLIGVGSASVLSRAIGKNDQKTVDKIMGNLIYWVIIFSTIMTVVGILFAPYFMDMAGASGEIKTLGIRYVRVLFLGSIFVNFMQAANMVMRGEGLMKKAMMIIGFAAIINIILDPIFMKLMGKYAIEGGAIASVIAQIIGASITFYYFKNKSKVVKIGKIINEKAVSSEMFSVGISSFVMQVFFIIHQMLFFKQSFAYGGDEWAIIMSAYLRIYAFTFIPLWGMAQGLQPIVGTNYGAKQYIRVKETMKIFIIYSTILAGIFWILVQIFSSQILALFKIDQNIILNNLSNFRWAYASFILYGIMIMTMTFFQSIGDAKKAGFLVLLGNISFIPAIIFLPGLYKTALWWANSLLDLIVVIIASFMLYKSLKNLKDKE